MDRNALNRYNAPEMLSAMFSALQVAGLEDTVDHLKKIGVSKIINDAWTHRPKLASSRRENWIAPEDLEQAWGSSDLDDIK